MNEQMNEKFELVKHHVFFFFFSFSEPASFSEVLLEYKLITKG